MSHQFYAFIDEAGDDGMGKFREIGKSGQSHWLTISALIVTSENSAQMPVWRDEINNAMVNKKKRNLHFEDLNHEQRVFACTVLANKPAGIVSGICNKTALNRNTQDGRFKLKNQLYKYVLRHVVERITESVRRKCLRERLPPKAAKIVFSRRGGMDYEDFQNYLKHLRDLQVSSGSWHPIYWDYIDIDAIEALDHSKLAALQLADIAASSFQKAVEPNFFGQTETRYAEILRPRVLRSDGGSWLNTGIKPIPSIRDMSLTPEQKAFFESWKESGQAPGS